MSNCKGPNGCCRFGTERLGIDGSRTCEDCNTLEVGGPKYPQNVVQAGVVERHGRLVVAIDLSYEAAAVLSELASKELLGLHDRGAPYGLGLSLLKATLDKAIEGHAKVTEANRRVVAAKEVLHQARRDIGMGADGDCG